MSGGIYSLSNTMTLPKPKPYLISLASSSSGVKRYLDSLKHLQDSVEWISVEFDPSFVIHDSIADHLSSYRRRWPQCPYPGNLKRFDYFPDFLDDSRWWIFTDTADVIFQAPVPDLEALGVEVLASCENELFADSWAFRPIIDAFRPKLDALLDKPIYCMGTWAMKGRLAKDLVAYLQRRGPEFGNHPFIDQPLFNLWLQEQDFSEHPDLFASLYKNYDLGKATRDEDGRFLMEGRLVSIAHGNGNSKSLFPSVL